MTNRDLRQLEEFANRRKPKKASRLEGETARLAHRTVDQLDEGVRLVEQTLRGLGLLMEDHTLPQALIGAMGISATELRSQLPALREAVKEAGK